MAGHNLSPLKFRRPASAALPTDEFGRTALHHAVVDGDTALVASLLKQGADPDRQDAGGYSPLHFAAQQWEVEAARLLLKAGARVDLEDGGGNQPLWQAAFNSRGRGELIQMLLEAGADPDHPNTAGRSPRQLAEMIGNYDVKQFFG